MANWYVNASADAGGDGTTAATTGANCAFQTIGAAVTASAATDTINVYPGTYAENVVLSKALTLQGTNRVTCLISKATGTGVVIGATNCYLKNLTITASEAAVTGIGVSCASFNNVNIDNCSVVGAYQGISLDTVVGGLLTNSSFTGGWENNFGSFTVGQVYNCSFVSTGDYAASSPATGVRGLISIGQVNYSRCLFSATTALNLGAGINCVGFIIPASGGGYVSTIRFEDCNFTSVGSGLFTRIAIGVQLSKSTASLYLTNCKTHNVTNTAGAGGGL